MLQMISDMTSLAHAAEKEPSMYACLLLPHMGAVSCSMPCWKAAVTTAGLVYRVPKLESDLPPLEHAKSGAVSQSTTNQASHTVLYHTASRPTSPVCTRSAIRHMRHTNLVCTRAKSKLFTQ